MFRYIPLMFKNGFRNRRRSILTIASIAVSFCVLGLLLALYRGMFLAGPATPVQAMQLVVHHKVSITQPLPVSYEAKIRNTPGVRDAMIWQWFGGTYKDARDQRNFFARFAIEPGKLLTVNPDVSLPADQMAAFEHDRTGCIVGKDLIDKFGWHIGDRITLVGDIFPVNLELKIDGVYTNPQDNASLYFNYLYLRELLLPQFPNRADSVGVFLVLTTSPDTAMNVAKTIDGEFQNAPAPTLTESVQAFALQWASFLGNLKLYLLAICAAITFTILLVSANTISMSVRERVREIGVLKTLGFTSESILGIILGETVVISIAGGLIGCGLAAFLCSGARNMPGTLGFLNAMRVTPSVALVCVAGAALIGIVSSFVPAWSASRTPIVMSLRHTG